MQISHKVAAPFLAMCGILCGGWGEGGALAADLTFQPSLSVSEEFNDNVSESARNKESDFVTRVQPGAALLYQSSLLTGDLRYALDYRNYAKGNKDDEVNHNLALRGNAELLPNRLYLEMSDSLSRVSLSVARDVSAESLSLNQNDQNRALISPYFLWRLLDNAVLKTGYRFSDIRYWRVSGNPSGINKQEHRVFADLNVDLSERLAIFGGYAFSSVDTEVVDYDQHDLSMGARYQYGEGSFLFGGAGNSWQSFSDSDSASNLFWNAGITNDFGFLVGTLEARVQYTEDPLNVSTKEAGYSARVDKQLQHGALGLNGSYTRYHETRSGGERRSRRAVTAFGRYELTPRLTATFTGTGDKVSRTGGEDYPYHFSGSAGISYGFNYDITASLSYSHAEYRHELDSPDDARQTNRVILEVRKVF